MRPMQPATATPAVVAPAATPAVVAAASAGRGNVATVPVAVRAPA